MESEKANNLPNNSKFHPTLKYLCTNAHKMDQSDVKNHGR